MSGTITCDSVTTSSITSSSDIQIGSYIWPSTSPIDGQIMTTDGSGNLACVYKNTRVAIGALITTHAIDVSSGIVSITGTLATTVTLPNPALKIVGDIIHIVKEVSGTSVITISPFSSELISGSASDTISASYSSIKVYTNGTDWFKI